MRPNRSLLAYALALAVPLCTWAQTESEPNNDFAQADAMTLNTAMGGTIGGAPCAGDASDDYFSLTLAEDGNLAISSSVFNSGASATTVRIYVYNAGGGQIAYFDHAVGPNGSPTIVTSTLNCANKGLYYIRPHRLNGSVCYTYSLTATLNQPTYADDLEPNNTFAEALLNPVLAANATMDGHVNFQYNNVDNNDYYLVQTGGDGRINVNISADAPGGGALRVYLYNDGGGQLNYFDPSIGTSGSPVNTTQSFTCYAQGAYYIRVTSINGCGVAYRLSYTVSAPVFANDNEPNNDFATALPLAHNSYTQGHLNFNHYGDNNDYYAITTPVEGTINVTLIAENAGTAAGSIRTYLYNSGGGQINYFDASVGASGDDDTTMASFTCYGQGAYYIRTTSINGCGFSYKVKYAMTGAVYGNDAEPNNTFAEAVANPLLPPNTFTEGHINFSHYGNNDDYYYVSTPAEGTLRITTIAERVPGVAGALRVYLYNNGGGQVDYYDASVGGSNDDDTTVALFDCYGQGNYYLRLTSINGCGISYKVKYEVLPAVYGNDAEPNNDFSQAQNNPLLAHNTFTDGHTNFSHYGDNNDYYYILTPGDGALRLTTIAERVPGVAGTLRVYVYNNGGGQIHYYDASVGGNNDDDTTVSVVDCYGQGNYYLRVTSINGCGISYRLKYEVLPPVYNNDPEPNNTFAQAVTVNPDSSSAGGHLNFAHTGDNDDYARVELAANGDISFLLNAENAGGGTIRTYLYNGGGGQLAYQDVPVGAGHVPVQTLVAFNGLGAGTYYIRLTSINGCGISYRLNCNDADGDGTCNYFDLCAGGPEPGTACDDGNANTTGDVIDAACNCVGTPVSCDDGDPCTTDSWNGSACVYTFQDADFDGTCDANDGCPNDGNKTAPGACGCGNPDVPTTWYADADGDGLGDPNTFQAGYTCDQPVGHVANASDACPAVTGTVGSACDDGNPNTSGDVLDGNCNCAGSPVNCDDGDPCTMDSWNGSACVNTFLDADNDGTCDANDGCPNDPNKTAPGVCGCSVTDVPTTWYADADGDGLGDPNDFLAGFTCNQPGGYVGDNTDLCPGTTGTVGSTCDDGDVNTTNDMLDANCNCTGTPVSTCTEQTINLSIMPDANGGEITWTLTKANGASVATGGPYTSATPGVEVQEQLCVPAGCYKFTLHDAGGDGITGGGYVLTDGQGNRLIDADGDFGAVSTMNTKFCLPVGPVELLDEVCDRTDLTLYDSLVTTTVADAYQFWFFDPHGTFSHRYTRTTNVIGPAPGANFPLDQRLNVRVRAHTGGAWTEFGPACVLQVQAAAGLAPGATVRMEAATTGIQLWPNPVLQGQVNLSITGLQADQQRITVDVYDLVGQRVLAREFGNGGDQFSTVLQLPGDLADGVYMVNITVNGVSSVHRLSVIK